MKIPLSLVKPILTVSSLVAVASITLETKPAAAACLSQPCVTVEVEGIKYDVSYKTGYLSDLESELSNQVWWGNANLASSFAYTVGTLLGTDQSRDFGWGGGNAGYIANFGDTRRGPVFAYLSVPSYSLTVGSSYWIGRADIDVWTWIWYDDSQTAGEMVYSRVVGDLEPLGIIDSYESYGSQKYAFASPSVPEPLTLGGTSLALVGGKIARRRAKQR